MALVTYGALVTELKGSIGGTTFQKNKAGNTARSRAYVPCNASQLQSNQQALLLQLIALWPTLSVANKTSWNTLATNYLHYDDWGVGRRLSGYQWFLAYNLNQMRYEGVYSLFPQAYTMVYNPQQFTLTASATTFNIHMSPAYTPPFNHFLIFATPPLRQSNIKLKKNAFFLNDFVITTFTDLNIRTYYENYFGVNWNTLYTSGNASIIVRIKNMAEDTGYVSAFTSAIIQIN
jgi:hypothetical protein